MYKIKILINKFLYNDTLKSKEVIMTTPMISGLKGTGYKQITSPLQNANQADLTNFLHSILGGSGFKQGLGQLSQLAGGDQGSFEALERPALRQFNALQGNLASRFSGMGTGARNSSGFQNASSGAAVDLAERLQSQRMAVQQNALSQLLGLSDSLLNRPTFQTGFIPKQQSMWEQLLSGLGGVTGQAGGQFGGLGLSKWAGLF